jgi:hypothetical protein
VFFDIVVIGRRYAAGGCFAGWVDRVFVRLVCLVLSMSAC